MVLWVLHRLCWTSSSNFCQSTHTINISFPFFHYVAVCFVFFTSVTKMNRWICSPILEEMQLSLNHSDGVEFGHLAGVFGWVNRLWGGSGGGFSGFRVICDVLVDGWVDVSGGVWLRRGGNRARSAS